jgi:hypothetical protein
VWMWRGNVGERGQRQRAREKSKTRSAVALTGRNCSSAHRMLRADGWREVKEMELGGRCSDRYSRHGVGKGKERSCDHPLASMLLNQSPLQLRFLKTCMLL